MKIEPELQSLAPAIELRVLIGPQSGSRLELSKGEYTLGSADDCNVILSGPRLEPYHARLDFDGEALSIEPLEGKIYDSRGAEITEICALMLGSAVEIGGVWICINNIDELWPDPMAVAALSLPLPAIKPQNNAEITQDENYIDLSKKSWPSRIRSNTKYSIFLVFLIFSVGLIFFLFYNTSPTSTESKNLEISSEPESFSEPENLKKLKIIIASLAPAPNITAEYNSNHRMTVSGYLPTNIQKNKIVQAIENTFPSARIHVYSDEEIFDDVLKHIELKNDHSKNFLKIRSVESGNVFLKGATSSSASRDSFLEKLRSSIKGIKEIKSNIMLLDDLPKILQGRILENSFSKKIEVTSSDTEFYIQGILSEPEIRKFEAILSGFSEEFGNILPIRAAIKIAPSKSPVPVQAILGGSFPLVITSSGEKITRGGIINGQVLINIQDDAAVFEGNSRYKISR